MRALLAIGCDSYDHVTPLSGAERDADRVFSALLSANLPFYDANRSTLLRSPCTDAVRLALKELLFDGPKLDVLTIYFAGHGKVANGSFFICLRDTRLGALSVTSLSLGDLFRYINEAKPAQTNIVIDACESGGLIEDLNVLLKGTLYGEAGTPGITLFAASASNQVAKETAEGGFATQALVSYITGEKFLRDDSQTLDLLEVGRRIHEGLSAIGQSPVMWGFNLYGPPQFCINPNYSVNDSELRQALKTAGDTYDQPAQREISDLWKIHYTLPEVWEPRVFVDALSACLKAFGSDGSRRGLLARTYYEATCSRIVGSSEAMLRSQVCAAMLAALLPWLHEAECYQLSRDVCDDLVAECYSAQLSIKSIVSEDRLAMLRHPGGGLADLFNHPIRISALMAWTALPLLISGEAAGPESVASFAACVEELLKAYPACMTVVCEEQAPLIAVAVSMLLLTGNQDLAAEALGYYFSSLTDSRSRIAASSLDGKAALSCLTSEQGCTEESLFEGAANPCEALAVVLRLGHAANLDEVFDPYLWQLDGAAGVLFVTDAWAEFSVERILQGNNSTFEIGRDVFRIAHLSAIDVSTSPSDPVQRLAVVATALLFPDRVPWFLIEEALLRNQLTTSSQKAAEGS